jgi:hypothetical protein
LSLASISAHIASSSSIPLGLYDHPGHAYYESPSRWHVCAISNDHENGTRYNHLSISDDERSTDSLPDAMEAPRPKSANPEAIEMTRAEGLTVIRELHKMEEIYRFRVALKQGLIIWAHEATTTYKEAKALSEEAERMAPYVPEQAQINWHIQQDQD